MRFTVTMACDNAAFGEDDFSLTVITGMMLKAVAEKVLTGRKKGAVVDPNGNVIGTFQFTEDRMDVV